MHSTQFFIIKTRFLAIITRFLNFIQYNMQLYTLNRLSYQYYALVVFTSQRFKTEICIFKNILYFCLC